MNYLVHTKGRTINVTTCNNDYVCNQSLLNQVVELFNSWFFN